MAEMEGFESEEAMAGEGTGVGDEGATMAMGVAAAVVEIGTQGTAGDGELSAVFLCIWINRVYSRFRGSLEGIKFGAQHACLVSLAHGSCMMQVLLTALYIQTHRYFPSRCVPRTTPVPIEGTPTKSGHIWNVDIRTFLVL